MVSWSSALFHSDVLEHTFHLVSEAMKRNYQVTGVWKQLCRTSESCMHVNMCGTCRARGSNAAGYPSTVELKHMRTSQSDSTICILETLTDSSCVSRQVRRNLAITISEQ